MRDQAEKLRLLAKNLKNKVEAEITGGPRQTRVLAITSGKGGVGKTNFTLNLGLALMEYGQRVILLDADMGMANIDVVLGIVPKYNLFHVINGERRLSEIIVEGPKGLRIIPGGSGIKELAALQPWQFEALMADVHSLEGTADILLIDTGAGVSSNVLNFLVAADEVIIVTTSEPTALTDAYGLIKIVSRENPGAVMKLIVNRVESEAEGALVAHKLKIVTKKFLDVELETYGHIIDDPAVSEAVKKQQPFILAFPYSPATQCVIDLAAKMCNQTAKRPAGLRAFFNNVANLFR